MSALNPSDVVITLFCTYEDDACEHASYLRKGKPHPVILANESYFSVHSVLDYLSRQPPEPVANAAAAQVGLVNQGHYFEYIPSGAKVHRVLREKLYPDGIAHQAYWISMTTRCNSCSFIVEHIVIIGPSWPAQAHSEDMAVDEGREAADTKATSDALNGPSKQNEDQYEEVALDEEGHGVVDSNATGENGDEWDLLGDVDAPSDAAEWEIL